MGPRDDQQCGTVGGADAEGANRPAARGGGERDELGARAVGRRELLQGAIELGVGLVLGRRGDGGQRQQDGQDERRGRAHRHLDESGGVKEPVEDNIAPSRAGGGYCGCSSTVVLVRPLRTWRITVTRPVDGSRHQRSPPAASASAKELATGSGEPFW